MPNKIIPLSLLIAGLSISALSVAAPDNSAGPEADADSQALFQQLDKNGDGQLSAAEMAALPQAMASKRLERIDTNHDGQIDKNEFEAAAKTRADRRFARMDRNGDGSISVAEMQPEPRNAGRQAQTANGSTSARDAGHGPHRWHHRRHHGMPSTDRMFAHMDQNDDGFVSADEWQQAARQWHHHYGPHSAGSTDDHSTT